MKKDKKIELTPELYKEISEEKTSRIVSLAQEKKETMETINLKKEQLADLLERKREIECELVSLRDSLQQSKTDKYKLSKEIVKEKRLSKKLNNAFTKGTFINLSKFIKEEENTKRR